MLALAKYRNDAVPVAPFRGELVDGPDAPLQPGAERPNIILIVADDLGYNDISTFGGGVADGRVPTPIDELAAAGAVFNQSYSGAGTCAPSRAMLMTALSDPHRLRIHTHPAGHGAYRQHGAESIPSNLPPGYFDAADEARMPYEDQACALRAHPGRDSERRRLRDLPHWQWHLGGVTAWRPMSRV